MMSATMADAGIGHNSGGRVRCIFRAHGDRGYTKLRNAFLQDRRISDETRGLVARLLSLPDDWEVTVQSIIASGKAGRDKVYRMIKEAEEFGYVRPEERSRSTQGKFDRQLYLVSDDPAALIERAAEELLAIELSQGTEIPTQSDGVTYVYVLKRDDLVKVGISSEPKKRLAHINYTSGQSPAEPCHFHASSKWEAAFIERAVHLRLSSKHAEGEWFRCTPEEAIAAIELAAKHPCTDFPDMDKVAQNKVSSPRPGSPDLAGPDVVEPYTANPTHKKNIEDKINIYPKDLLSDQQAGADDPEPKLKRSRKAAPDQYTYDFEEFWKVYPRREGKGAAFKAWQRMSMANKRKAYVELKRQLPELTERARHPKGNFCAHPATWINERRFDDDHSLPAPADVRPANMPEAVWQKLQADKARAGA